MKNLTVNGTHTVPLLFTIIIISDGFPFKKLVNNFFQIIIFWKWPQHYFYSSIIVSSPVILLSKETSPWNDTGFCNYHDKQNIVEVMLPGF
jgi:hypothetical protein